MSQLSDASQSSGVQHNKPGDASQPWGAPPDQGLPGSESLKRGLALPASSMDLLKFQADFIRGAFASGIRTAALSLPRGNGKSTLAAHICLRALTPGDSLHFPGTESLLIAASLQQAQRTVFGQLGSMLPAEGYRVANSINRSYIEHVASGTRISCLAASYRSAQGMVSNPLVIADEPGAWQTREGTALFDAVQTAQGKPGSQLRAVYIGTLAPALDGWWHDLVSDGSNASTFVMLRQGNRKTWDSSHVLRAANPLMWKFADSRKVLLEERDAARKDSRLKARFLSYRLNIPTADESIVLLTVEEFDTICNRPVPPRAGRPIVGVDLGGGRAWSAATAVWPNGRVEALATAPGIPSLDAQEKRDRVPPGLYRKLLDTGRLRIATGLRVQPPAQLIEAIRPWNPEVIICDRFRLAELKDTRPPCPVNPRVSRWSEASEDIRSLRKMAKDGPLSIEPSSRDLLAHSLSQTRVVNDDQGNFRLRKKDPANNCSRDDVAAALVLAAGLQARRPVPRPRRHRIAGAA